MKRISFYTLGCRLNQAETAVLQNSFDQNHYKVVDFKEPADIVVINTCTVTEHGDTDTRRLVNKINRINPKSRIALIGCQAQIQKQKLAKLPNVHWIIGNEKKMDLVSILKGGEAPDVPAVITPTISRNHFTLPAAGIDRQHTRANLKIQDGCDFFCSFCEIPYARGRSRSREFEDILLEAEALVKANHKEIVLTGINLGSYQYQQKTFLDVIKALEQIDDLCRIRISSIEPTTIPFELFDHMKKKSKLCRYLHIPIQSGSNKILAFMKRKYTTKIFSKFILEAYKKVPHLCIGTDVMVGFPGETEKNFKETEQFLENHPFAYFHVFSYSRREMAKSRLLGDCVDTDTIAQRSKILRDLSNRKRRTFNKNLIGSKQKVLFEQKKNGFWSGLTDHYVQVKVHSSQPLSNQLFKVNLKKIEGTSIIGDLMGHS